MRHYIGERTPAGCTVEVLDRDNPNGGYELPPRHDLRWAGANGFDWGTVGIPGEQLSVALIADAVGDREAKAHFQAFKSRVIAPLEGDTWEMSQEDVLQAVRDIERTRGRTP